ncbi:MAG: hypothetical protein ABJB47_10305 [Actinomycetota bacterium]
MSPLDLTPFTVLNWPPTKTVPAAGPGSTAKTGPFSDGRKPVFSAPVDWLKATMPVVGIALDDPCAVALVDVPPATMVVPACAIA